jgi:hypothetical protein
MACQAGFSLAPLAAEEFLTWCASAGVPSIAALQPARTIQQIETGKGSSVSTRRQLARALGYEKVHMVLQLMLPMEYL